MDGRSDEAVYAAHVHELVRFATGLVGPDDAADVVVESFVRLVRAPAWNEATDRRALWFRAVLFQAKTWSRSAARRRSRETAHALATQQVAPDTDVPDTSVLDALDALSPQQRAIVFLTYWHDLDPPGVAELLGISDGSVRKQLARARKTLRGVLS